MHRQFVGALRCAGLCFLFACGSGEDARDRSTQQALGGSAVVKLEESSAHMTLSSATSWTLAKHGSIDSSTSTVTWTVTAAQGTTVANQLIVHGSMTVRNIGTGPATIGNIVVNLQTRTGGAWVTRSSDIADATEDDHATTAKVVDSASSENQSAFTENAASGDLSFMDVSTNSMFALFPQVTIAPGALRELLFTATFDNNVLQLAPGTSTRVEVLVSFGNASTGGSKPNLDINGNGVIDADEARVRTVPTRLGLTVPAQTATSTPRLTDTLTDITTTGTVTFTGPQFEIGTTTGSVTGNFNGGESGGSVTNCAHLRSPPQQVSFGGHTFTIPGLDLASCDTQAISPHPCAPGAPGCGWQKGDVIAHAQDAWGDPTSTAGPVLVANFVNLYPVSLEIGIAGEAGSSIRFTSALAVFEFLPAGGPPGPLTADLIDPTSSSSGQFAGNVLALQIDVDLSDADALSGSSGLRFGDLRLCNFAALPELNDMNVRQFLGHVNTVLGGGSGPGSIDDLDPITFELTRAFVGGAPSTFAQQHVFAGRCPCPPGALGCGWKSGDVIAYGENLWGFPGSAAAGLLILNFDNIYVLPLEVGIPGTAGFSIRFFDAFAVFDYLPAVGPPGPLAADLIDPSGSTISGQFGGDVVALQLDVDLSDAGKLVGTSGLRFGDLLLCNFRALPDLNGRTVRQFLAQVNNLLGGGGGTTPNRFLLIDTLDQILFPLTLSFVDGVPTKFAQQHVFTGACPLCTASQPDCVWGRDFGTLDQEDWSASTLVTSFFVTFYGSALEIGIPGPGKFSMRFSDAASVLNYLPAAGPPGALTADLINPTSSPSGQYGGNVLALKLQVDFSDTDILSGSAGQPFGDVLLCNFPAQSGLNGMKVREFLVEASNLLGGGNETLTIAEADPIAFELTRSFKNATPSSFAQQHLFAGSCPP